MSDGVPPELLSDQGFEHLGLRFPLFQAPISQAREYAGPGRCDVCFSRAHCFSLEAGSELIAECPSCLEEAPLDLGSRADRGCPSCAAAVVFPLARTGRLRACAACLQAGLVSLGKRTELGEVRWGDALEGLTAGGPQLQHPDVALVPGERHGWSRGVVDRLALLELVRTPNFDDWGGAGRWLFCCGLPMIYRGSWGVEGFRSGRDLGGGERMFLSTVEDTTGQQWADLNRGRIETQVFACASCGRLRGRWSRLSEDARG